MNKVDEFNMKKKLQLAITYIEILYHISCLPSAHVSVRDLHSHKVKNRYLQVMFAIIVKYTHDRRRI